MREVDWRVENEECGRISLNDWNDKKNGYDRDLDAVNIVRGWFETCKIKPKILSFNEAVEEGIVRHERVFYKNDEKMHILDCYGKAWLDRGHWPSPANTAHKASHAEWNEWIHERENNEFFHSCKIQWLCNIIKTEGLYSVPQATYRKSEWFVHPGQFRVLAIDYTGCNEEFVVWDYNGRLRADEIDWEEYWNLYKHHDDKSLFCVNFGNHLEMHVGEEREDLYKVIKGSTDAFEGRKPILQGTCDESLKDLFIHGTYDGTGIGIVGHVGQEDLRHMLDFFPTKQIIEKESFTLYNNYHK